ncbi:MAG TPA: class I SAM-dependent methyltransferase [Pseudonocardia sp.]|nr:class I SAM-dependent methyltransferase [Pseudonocardia sp.]
MDRQTDEIVAYYTDRYREDLRLGARPQARLERIRTAELLDALLPAGARVLDVGGGPGAYARALAGAGHRVRLLDLTPTHVELARAGDPPLDAAVADARALPEPDAAYDATLLLGPLYHLTSAADRIAALREAVRVTRPGGRVVAAAISRFAGPIDFAATARLSDRLLAEAGKLRVDGVNDGANGFTHAYFHRVEELVDECRAAGLTDLEVHGVEGPAWPAAEAAVDTPQADAVFAGALGLARVVSGEPSLVMASAHLLATGRVTVR